MNKLIHCFLCIQWQKDFMEGVDIEEIGKSITQKDLRDDSNDSCRVVGAPFLCTG